MIKMIVAVWKKPGLSDEEFEDLWFNGHGPLCKRYSPAMGIVKYVQNHKLPSKLMENFSEHRGWARAPDGVAEAWWESEESMMKALATPEGHEASMILKEDEERFIHPPEIIAFMSTEETIYDHTGQ
jgi:uncharacterized protein (TIGR02118 family)